jgi:hypothetical protein
MTELQHLLRTGPFHAALHAAIRQRGLTLHRLRTHLARRGVTVALSSLSDWRLGRVRPVQPNSLRAVAELERILAVPEHALLDLLAASGPDGWPTEIPGLVPGFGANDLDMVSRHDTVLVDARRRAGILRSHAVMRARRDGVDRFFMHYYGDRTIPLDRIVVQPLRGCRLGRVVHEDRECVLVAEMLADRPLAAGDTWVFEYEVHDPTAETCVEHKHGIRGFEEQCLLEVRFHPDALPVDCHAFVQRGPDDEPERTAHLVLAVDGAVHHLETAATADWIGIRWRWP